MNHTQPTPHSDEIDLCKGCGTMKHLNSDGLCGRCTPHSDKELESLLDEHAIWYIRRTIKLMQEGKEPSFVTGTNKQDEKSKQALLQWSDRRAEKLVVEARKSERIKVRQLYAKRNPLYTKQWIADYLGISRPTLSKWLDNPEKFTIGAIEKLAALTATKDGSE